MKALVTGGAGFIGKHLCSRLRQAGMETDIYDITYNDDIGNSDRLCKAAKGKDIIFHLAAELEVLRGIDQPSAEAGTNILGTINVLEAARQAGVQKVVFASSSSVYGEPEHIPTVETDLLKPLWPYGVTKLCGEHYCNLYTELYGLPTVCLRYSIVYGQGEWYRRVLTKFTKAMLQGKPVTIFGDGWQTRDYIHVSDMVEATLLAATRDVTRAFNIGSGTETSVLRLAEMLQDITGSPHNIEYANPPAGTEDRKPHEQQRMCLNITKAQRLLGWQPKVSLLEGLKGYVEYYREHLNEWE